LRVSFKIPSAQPKCPKTAAKFVIGGAERSHGLGDARLFHQPALVRGFARLGLFYG
jgi:hypothetical protein